MSLMQLIPDRDRFHASMASLSVRHPLVVALICFRDNRLSDYQAWIDYYLDNLPVYAAPALVNDLFAQVFLSYAEEYLDYFLEKIEDYQAVAYLQKLVIPAKNLAKSTKYQPTPFQLEVFQEGSIAYQVDKFLAEYLVNDRMYTSYLDELSSFHVANFLCVRDKYLANNFLKVIGNLDSHEISLSEQLDFFTINPDFFDEMLSQDSVFSMYLGHERIIYVLPPLDDNYLEDEVILSRTNLNLFQPIDGNYYYYRLIKTVPYNSDEYEQDFFTPEEEANHVIELDFLFNRLLLRRDCWDLLFEIAVFLKDFPHAKRLLEEITPVSKREYALVDLLAGKEVDVIALLSTPDELM